MSTKPTQRVFKETHVLEGEVRWAKVQTPNEDGKYTADMILDSKGIKLMDSLGIPVKTDKNDDSIKFVTFTRFANNQDGTPKPFKVIDAKLNPFTDLVGNGSICRIEFFDREWTYGRKSGTQAYMVGFQVRELVEYAPKVKSKLESDDFGDDNMEDMEANKFTAGKKGK